MSHTNGLKQLHFLMLLSSLLLLGFTSDPALAQNYNLTSLFSINSSLGNLPAFSPSINNLGHVAYPRFVFDPVDNRNEFIVMIHDGNSETQFFNITDNFGGSAGLNANLVINDNGDVAAKVDAPSTTSPCPNVFSCVIRINANQTITVLATAKNVGGGGDFAEFEQWLDINNAGQVAVRVRRESDGTNQVVRLDGPGQFAVIFTQTASLFNPTQPTINDAGVVAFAAQEPQAPGVCSGIDCTSVYSGTGGPLTNEGRRPGGGNSSHAPIINNNGLVLDTGVVSPALIYTAQGSNVNTLVIGNEDRVFNIISSSVNPGQNNFGDFVFGSQASGFPEDFGIFTGNNPALHKVVRKGDVIFGGPVSAGSFSIRSGLHHINNAGQIVFALTVDVSGPHGSFTSHIVRADPLPPETTITDNPPLLTNVNSASFQFTSSKMISTFECSLDSAAFSACTTPQMYNGLADGSRNFQVRAVDSGDRADPTPASYTWTVDTTPPDTTITASPAPITNSTSANFSFTSTEGGSTFECSLDGAAFSSCTSPQAYSSLAAGPHNFQARATDPATNTDLTPASFNWTIDLTPPDTMITSNPPPLTNSTNASFSFTSTEGSSTFECSLDGAAFSSCSSPQNYNSLSNGPHNFQVRATDPATNTDPTPASFHWTIDTIAPDTTITNNPPSMTTSTSASFSFTSTEGSSTFECSLDSAAFSSCTSPQNYNSLATGGHDFQVRATDPAGNTDSTPASFNWTINPISPSAPVDFDGDGTSDIVVFRGGAWLFYDFTTGTQSSGVWTGTAPGCIPVAMDYNGDGSTDFTQLCGGAWHFYNSNGSYNKGIWVGGLAGDRAVPADYDGDGTDDVVVYREGAWLFYDFATGLFNAAKSTWTGGGASCIPVPMDYDGDGTANFTQLCNGSWHFYNSNGSYNKGIWTGGVAGDKPVPADYDGDGTEDVVVFRLGAWLFYDFATGLINVAKSAWTGAPPHWTGGTSLPAPIDYDGDGKVDFTVYSGGPWHFYNSNGSYNKGIWTGGVVGDRPISRRLLP